MTDPFNLQRFLDAQNPVFGEVLDELRRGSKQGHWMWFIFPQLAGLGHSWMAQKYAISSRAEAEAYFAHPVLGSRLKHCTELVNAVEGRSLEQVLGSIDALKFGSSVTLFDLIAPRPSVFTGALTKYFAGQADRRTLDSLLLSHGVR